MYFLYGERQTRDGLSRIEEGLKNKIETSSNGLQEELAEISNRLAVLEHSFKKQEVAVARQLELVQQVQQIEVDLREVRADVDNSWSTTASRYSIAPWGPALDPYTLEELKRAYERARPIDRVRLLRKLQSQHPSALRTCHPSRERPELRST